MPERILIGVAWPYANGSLHMGHIAGCYLAADVFARYHRLKGNDVLMVSGSDQHGTPITLRAEQDGVSPQEVVSRYHKEFLESWGRLGITFDLFTTTGTDNHRETVQDIFRVLQEKGYIYTAITPLPYCHTCRRFLPDRYVKGTCPHCGNTDGRGDQCDQCGKPLNPEDLIGIQCRISGDAPEIRNSEHFFLKLSAFQETLLAWVREQRHWRPNVLNFTQRYLEDGLKDRAISRDLDWGVPLPVDGYDAKRIYVWFEAVIGYLSASKEWAKLRGRAGGVGTLLAWRRQELLLHRQGQHTVPHHHLARHACRLRRTQPPVRRAGQRVPQPGGQAAVNQPQLGRVGAGLPGQVRPGPTAVLHVRDYAGDQRLRFLLARLCAAEQR